MVLSLKYSLLESLLHSDEDSQVVEQSTGWELTMYVGCEMMCNDFDFHGLVQIDDIGALRAGVLLCISLSIGIEVR